MGRILYIIKFLFDKNIPIREKWWVIIPVSYTHLDVYKRQVVNDTVYIDLRTVLEGEEQIIYDEIKNLFK